MNIIKKTWEDEPQILLGMYDDKFRHTGFVDLRPLIDDKTVLKNPHKGWYVHFIDNGYRRPNYRDGIEKGDYLKDFPGLNHMYLRFDWSDVETSKGVYDWSYLDNIMDEWGAQGYRFSLRMCCFETGLPYATPKYVFEEGAVGIDLGDSGPQPDYGDPIFLKYLEKFVEKFAEKYDGDPRVEIVDIGSYGTWGEGHTHCGDFRIYPSWVVKKHFDIHSKYFKKTFLLINDDHIIGRLAHGEEEVSDMLDYADARGFGLQDDSICCGGYAIHMQYDTMRAKWAFDKLYKNAPNCIELEHYCIIEKQEQFRHGFTVMEALKKSHATYAGFHGNPRKWLNNEKDLTEYCANRLGYWFFVTSAVVPELKNTSRNKITITIENHGWAPCFYDYDLKLKIGDKVITSDFDVRTLDSDEKAEVIIKADLTDMLPGVYDVKIGLFEGETPIKLALKDEVYEDGYYKIAKTSIIQA